MTAYLSKLPFWKELNQSQKEYLLNNTSIRHYNKGTSIFSCDSSCLGMTYVIKGSIRVYILSDEGREITLFRLKKEEPCVLSASCVISQITFDTHMDAEQDCDLLVINSSALKKITEENIYAKCFMYELMTNRFSSVMWTMQQILFEKLDRRLAVFLLQEYDKTKSTEIHMTHEQIAQQINSAREVVARMLKSFAADGLVEMKRGAVILKDTESLRKI